MVKLYKNITVFKDIIIINSNKQVNARIHFFR